MIGSKFLNNVTALILAVTLLEIGCKQKPDDICMDINDAVVNKEGVDAFIRTNFERVNSAYMNPIFPYKVNYKSKDSSITFCDLPVIDSWALKSGTSYTFFLIVRNVPNLVKIISTNYGKHEIESEVQINNNPGAATYYWQNDKINIILSKFVNVGMVKKYEDCCIVIIGNMAYKNIVSLG